VRELARERQMATIFITHDLALASEYCDRIVVMHAGHVVEVAPTRELFSRPCHPYTARLIASTPTREGSIASLSSIPGNLPDLRRADLPKCRFHARCERATEECARDAAPAVALGDGHRAYCFHPLVFARADDAKFPTTEELRKTGTD
jgi:peptide/nickel transport system ATP-binding protein